MKKILLIIALALFLGGCSDEKIDTEFLCEEKNTTIIIEAPNPIPYCQPVPCEETIYGHLTDEWLSRIDANNVKLNHYINDELTETNIADIVDLNGTLATTNPITIPEYIGEPMKHVLIIEFWQTN